MSCISFVDRCNFQTGWQPQVDGGPWPTSNATHSGAGRGRFISHLIYGIKKFNTSLRKWEPIVYEPDSCAQNAGGYAFVNKDINNLVSVDSPRRWRTQHKYSSWGPSGTKCLQWDRNDLGNKDDFVGSPQFMRFRRRWAMRHKYRNSSLWDHTAEVGTYGPLVDHHPLTPWDNSALGGTNACMCCGMDGTVGSGAGPVNVTKPVNVPPPKIYVRFKGYMAGNDGACTGFYNNRVDFDVEVEMIRINLGWGYGDPTITLPVIAYYTHTQDVSSGSQGWGTGGGLSREFGRVLIRTLSINGDTHTPDSQPWVYTCLAPDLCTAGTGCAHMQAYMVCKDSDMSTWPAHDQSPTLFLRDGCPSEFGKAYLSFNAFEYTVPNANAGWGTAHPCYSECFDDCSSFETVLQTATGNCHDDPGCVGGQLFNPADQSFTMTVKSTPHYDWPRATEFSTENVGYFNENGFVRNSDWEDPFVDSKFWRDQAKDPANAPAP